MVIIRLVILRKKKDDGRLNRKILGQDCATFHVSDIFRLSELCRVIDRSLWSEFEDLLEVSAHVIFSIQ